MRQTSSLGLCPLPAGPNPPRAGPPVVLVVKMFEPQSGRLHTQSQTATRTPTFSPTRSSICLPHHRKPETQTPPPRSGKGQTVVNLLGTRQVCQQGPQQLRIPCEDTHSGKVLRVSPASIRMPGVRPVPSAATRPDNPPDTEKPHFLARLILSRSTAKSASPIPWRLGTGVRVPNCVVGVIRRPLCTREVKRWPLTRKC